LLGYDLEIAVATKQHNIVVFSRDTGESSGLLALQLLKPFRRSYFDDLVIASFYKTGTMQFVPKPKGNYAGEPDACHLVCAF